MIFIAAFSTEPRSFLEILEESELHFNKIPQVICMHIKVEKCHFKCKVGPHVVSAF
jgi:hypothetical protein